MRRPLIPPVVVTVGPVSEVLVESPGMEWFRHVCAYNESKSK